MAAAKDTAINCASIMTSRAPKTGAEKLGADDIHTGQDDHQEDRAPNPIHSIQPLISVESLKFFEHSGFPYHGLKHDRVNYGPRVLICNPNCTRPKVGRFGGCNERGMVYFRT